MDIDVTRVVEDIEVAIVIEALDGSIVYANRTAHELLGASPGQLVGLAADAHDWDHIGRDGSTIPPDRVPSRHAARTGEVVRDAVLGVRRVRDGERIWVRVSARRQEAEPHAVLVTFEDASSEVQATRTLQDRAEELEARLEVVLETMSDGLVVHDTDGSILIANRGAASTLLLSPEQLAGRQPMDPGWSLTEPGGEPLQPGSIPSEITRKTGTSVRGRLLRVQLAGGGQERWLSVSSDPLPGPLPCRVVASFSDVTSEFLAQRELRASEARFRRVVNAIPGVIYQIEYTGDLQRTVFVSGPTEALLGRESTDVFREGGIPELHPQDVEEVEARLARARAHPGEAEEVEFRVRLASGRYAWRRQRFVAESFSEEHAVITGVIVDISAQHALQDRVRRSQRLDAMSSLAAGVAHNFNNALAAILPNLEILLARAPSDMRSELLDARAAAESASKLVRRLLQAVRGERPEDLRVIDAAESMRSVVAICRGAFGPDLPVEAGIVSEPAPVRATSDLLQQTVLNLAINARDALEGRADPQLEMRLELDPEAAQVRILVRDNGSGMTPEVLAHLGEPFFTTKEPGRGTGLGLATVYGIVAELGGRIEVDSSAGKGTTFTVSLPLVAEEAIREPSEPPDETESGHIMVVDDEPLVRTALVRMLRSLGHTVTECDSGPAALERLDEEPADLILLDLSMPVLSGLDVLRRVRVDHASLPVIIITGHMDDREGLDEATAVLRKPVSREQLESILSRYL